jgi:hypothetical protein
MNAPTPTYSFGPNLPERMTFENPTFDAKNFIMGDSLMAQRMFGFCNRERKNDVLIILDKHALKHRRCVINILKAMLEGDCTWNDGIVNESFERTGRMHIMFDFDKDEIERSMNAMDSLCARALEL